MVLNCEKSLSEGVLVTGGTGFAGRNVIRCLLQDGQHVHAIVRDQEKLIRTLGEGPWGSGYLTPIEMENPEKAIVPDLTKLIEENGITTVIHIAGIVGETKASWNEYYETNVSWTKNLACAFLTAKVNHNKFIFTSSVGVYGTIPRQTPANEEMPCNPDGKYHKTKVLAEKELLELKTKSGLPLIILRPTIMYGNEDNGFLNKFFRLMAKKVFPLSKGNPQIHLLDVEILAEACLQLTKTRDMPKNFVFNVGDSDAVKIRDLSEFISSSMDSGCLSVPSFAFSLLRKIIALNSKYSVSIKLISQSWFYNVDRFYATFDIKPASTIQTLNKKYLTWYRGN